MAVAIDRPDPDTLSDTPLPKLSDLIEALDYHTLQRASWTICPLGVAARQLGFTDSGRLAGQDIAPFVVEFLQSCYPRLSAAFLHRIAHDFDLNHRLRGGFYARRRLVESLRDRRY